MLQLPPLDSPAALREHFREVGRHFALATYDDAIYTCQACCSIGENKLGKEGNPAGRSRYCSPECEAVARAYEALRKVVHVEDTAATKPSRTRRSRADAEVPETEALDGGGDSTGEVRDDAGIRERQRVSEVDEDLVD